MGYTKHFRIIHEHRGWLKKSVPHILEAAYVDAADRIEAGEKFIRENPGRRILSIKEI